MKSVTQDRLPGIPLLAPSAGLIADFLGRWYGHDFRDRLHIVAEVDSIYYELALGLVHGALIATGAAAQAAVEGRGAGSPGSGSSPWPRASGTRSRSSPASSPAKANAPSTTRSTRSICCGRPSTRTRETAPDPADHDRSQQGRTLPGMPVRRMFYFRMRFASRCDRLDTVRDVTLAFCVTARRSARERGLGKVVHDGCSGRGPWRAGLSSREKQDVPEAGQLVRVRGQQWVVSSVNNSHLAQDELAATRIPGRTLVTLTSGSDDGLGDELTLA